jgi:LacI family transcriptional regulator
MTSPRNIKEIAQRLGVAPSTVSKTLNGNGRVSVATRERILAGVEEAGYTPNLNGQRLVTGRSYIVALKAGYREKKLSDLFCNELIDGIQEMLQSLGYGVLLDTGGNTLQHWVKSRGVDGVIALGGFARDNELATEIAQMASENGIPSVVIGHTPIENIFRVGSVVTDLQAGVREAAQELVARGHRRIAHVGSYRESKVLAMFRRELAERDCPLDDSLVRLPGPSTANQRIAIQELLTLPTLPTAIFVRNDALAAMILQSAHVLGIKVPEDISLIGHDDIPLAALLTPPLTTIRVDCGALGRSAIDMLFKLMTGSEEPIPSILPTRLIQRDTLKTVSALPT